MSPKTIRDLRGQIARNHLRGDRTAVFLIDGGLRAVSYQTLSARSLLQTHPHEFVGLYDGTASEAAIRDDLAVMGWAA